MTPPPIRFKALPGPKRRRFGSVSPVSRSPAGIRPRSGHGAAGAPPQRGRIEICATCEWSQSGICVLAVAQGASRCQAMLPKLLACPQGYWVRRPRRRPEHRLQAHQPFSNTSKTGLG